jgi:hypothetical protein
VADDAVLTLLKARLPARHATAAVRHFRDAVLEYQKRKWDDASAKAGKFVEAVLKALVVHTNLPNVPTTGRGFSAGVCIDRLAGAQGFDDNVRLTIPRACRFIYDIASNRGARHDPDEIDPNEMDATSALSASAWVLAELLRYAQKGGDLAQTAALVAGLMRRRYPFIEEVDGRVYFHVPGISARGVALLTLRHRYPGRVARAELIAAVKRHRFTDNNANVAVSRLGKAIDDDGQGLLKLLIPGLQEAERLIDRAQQRSA